MARSSNNFKTIIKTAALSFIATLSFLTTYGQPSGTETKLVLNDSSYFETRGLNVQAILYWLTPRMTL